MKIKKYLPQIIVIIMGISIFMITLSVVIFGIPKTDNCVLCGNPICHTPSKVDPNGWIAENGGGGTPSQAYPLLTTNLLAQIEQRLDALDSDVNEIKDITGDGSLFEIYLELGRGIDRNGHRIDAILNRLERLEHRTPPSP